MKNILFLFTFCAFVSACNTSNKTTTTTPTTEDNTVAETVNEAVTGLDDNPVFYLHRESCRGTCPGYTLTIFESGKVDYAGIRNVERVGNHIATMGKTTLTVMKKIADKIEVQKMEDEYIDKQIMDVPTMTFKYNDKSIKFFEYLGPEELKNFCKEIDKQMENLSWEKIE